MKECVKVTIEHIQDGIAVASALAIHDVTAFSKDEDFEFAVGSAVGSAVGGFCGQSCDWGVESVLRSMTEWLKYHIERERHYDTDLVAVLAAAFALSRRADVQEYEQIEAVLSQAAKLIGSEIDKLLSASPLSALGVK